MKLFSEFPYLENERLVLKKLTDADADALAEMSADENVRKTVPAFLADYSYSDAKEAISHMNGEYFENKQSIFLGIFLKSDINTLTGILEIYNYEPYWHKASIGYRLAQKYWGQGIAKDAAQLAMDYLLNNTDISRLTGHVLVENIRSANILKSLGFRLRVASDYEDWGFENKVLVNKYIYE